MKKILGFSVFILIAVFVYAADVIIFDEGASPEKVLDYKFSVDTPDYQGRTDVLINPVIVSTHSFKYWKHSAGQVVSMTEAERNAQDAAEAAALVASYRNQAVDIASSTAGGGMRLRALVELLNKRDNYLINRVIELQDAMDAMKASTGGADNIRAAIPASWLATNTRTKLDAVNEYRDDINAGNQDNP